MKEKSIAVTTIITERLAAAPLPNSVRRKDTACPWESLCDSTEPPTCKAKKKAQREQITVPDVPLNVTKKILCLFSAFENDNVFVLSTVEELIIPPSVFQIKSEYKPKERGIKSFAAVSAHIVSDFAVVDDYPFKSTEKTHSGQEFPENYRCHTC